MPRAYSVDLRERVLAAARDAGLSHRAVAERSRVGESTVRRWLRRQRAGPAVAPKPHAGGTRSRVDAAGAAALEGSVEQRDALTLAELAGAYRERTGVAYVNADGVDYINARRIINGTDRAALTAAYADRYRAAIRVCRAGGRSVSSPPDSSSSKRNK